MAMDIGPGDEVITNANTFFATAEAIWIAGATAVLIDCDPKTKCIDPAKIEAAITPKTKAIIPVHHYGQCADMKAIKAIADEHRLRVIEDNAQAIGAAGDGFRSANSATRPPSVSSFRRTSVRLATAELCSRTTQTSTPPFGNFVTTARQT